MPRAGVGVTGVSPTKFPAVAALVLPRGAILAAPPREPVISW